MLWDFSISKIEGKNNVNQYEKLALEISASGSSKCIKTLQ